MTQRQRQTEQKTRFDRGTSRLAEVDGQAGAEVVASLGDLGRYIVEFAFGDIYSREGLNLRDRELATVAALTALGGREPQLKVHIGAAQNVGLTEEEIEEIILQTVPYAGFPTAINAMKVFKEVVAQTEHG